MPAPPPRRRHDDHAGLTTRRPRRVSSLDALRAFEVAARYLSFTKAAAELCITQGAVSQRIKVLESELGLALFKRRALALVLTAEGELLAEGVRAGPEQIIGVIAALQDGSARPLVISVLPSFASRWLIPRLNRFTRLHPDVTVQILADIRLPILRDSGTEGDGSGTDWAKWLESADY